MPVGQPKTGGPCNSEGGWGPGPDRGERALWAWEGFQPGSLCLSVLLMAQFCWMASFAPRLYENIFLWISMSRFVYPGLWLIYDGKEQSLEIWLLDTCKPLSALKVWLSKEFCKQMKCFYYFVIITSSFFFLYKIRIAVLSPLPGLVSNKHLRF